MATSALQLKADEIRAKRVDWDQYKQGQLLSSEDYLIIVQLDSTASQQRDVLLKERPNECARALMNILGKLAKEETLYYSLTLIDDILEEDLYRTKIFFQYAQTTKETAWKPFMGLLNRDGFISNQASHILAKLASFSGETLEEKDLKYLINWLKEHLVDKKNEYIETTIHCLQVMLRIKPYRDVFFELDGVDAILSRLNTPKIGFQLQYQLIYCFWVLTFDADGVERISKKNIIPTLSDTLSDSNKEKVHRIIFATFKNLLELASEVETRRCNSLAMVQCRVQRELQRVDVRKWIDEDLNADLVYLTNELALCVQDFSSFDEYSTEVRSGRLEWSPAHRSEKFWRDNVTRLNEKDFEILKLLVKLLEVSNDPLVLSVAAHDVGQYVRLYPRGKKILETLGGKQRVMILLAHTDPNVRYEALLAVQKIMVHNWEYLGKQLQALDSQAKEKTQL